MSINELVYALSCAGLLRHLFELTRLDVLENICVLLIEAKWPGLGEIDVVWIFVS
jgi:hypothetical protein